MIELISNLINIVFFLFLVRAIRNTDRALIKMCMSGLLKDRAVSCTFPQLVKIMKAHGDKIVTHKDYAHGTILKYKFRVFEEDDSNYAYVAIFDEYSVDGKTPAYYNEQEIKEWIELKEKENK
jgi:hypothetical protein